MMPLPSINYSTQYGVREKVKDLRLTEHYTKRTNGKAEYIKGGKKPLKKWPAGGANFEGFTNSLNERDSMVNFTHTGRAVCLRKSVYEVFFQIMHKGGSIADTEATYGSLYTVYIEEKRKHQHASLLLLYIHKLLVIYRWTYRYKRFIVITEHRYTPLN